MSTRVVAIKVAITKLFGLRHQQLAPALKVNIKYYLAWDSGFKIQDSIKNDPLPPLIPAHRLWLQIGEHYLAFDDLYEHYDKSKEERVVWLQFQNLNLRCVFSMNSVITVDGQRELDDIIFSCGTILHSKNLYTTKHLNCVSLVENTYHSSKTGKQTTLIKDATSESSDEVILLSVVL